MIPVSVKPPIRMTVPMKGNFWLCNIFKRFKEFEKQYDIAVENRVVLDIGAFIGDTPLYWICKGARKVYAVEPVPEHYEVLCFNARGLPIVPILGSVGCRVPKVSELTGLGSYGEHGLLVRKIKGCFSWIDVPEYSLIELVEKYDPDIVKIDCEGCEHYILDEIVACRGKDIVVEFHDTYKRRKEVSLAYIEKYLGKPIITFISKSGGAITAIWPSKKNSLS